MNVLVDIDLEFLGSGYSEIASPRDLRSTIAARCARCGRMRTGSRHMDEAVRWPCWI